MIKAIHEFIFGYDLSGVYTISVEEQICLDRTIVAFMSLGVSMKEAARRIDEATKLNVKAILMLMLESLKEMGEDHAETNTHPEV